MTLESKLKELSAYEKVLKQHYPKLSEFKRLQISVGLMSCNTKEEVQTYLTKF